MFCKIWIRKFPEEFHHSSRAEIVICFQLLMKRLLHRSRRPDMSVWSPGHRLLSRAQRPGRIINDSYYSIICAFLLHPPPPFEENIFEFLQDSAKFKLMNGATRFRVSGMVYKWIINYVPIITYLHPVYSFANVLNFFTSFL